MLLKEHTLAKLADGTIDTVYRRWSVARIAAGSRFRTSRGVFEVVRIDRVGIASIRESDARKAGYASKAELLAEIARYGKGATWRIVLRAAGADPRVALRSRARLSREEREALDAKLARMGASSADGPWAERILRLIRDRPAVRAPDLAQAIGMPTSRFKPRVRQLKELGLTESLEVGYRLSARGRAWLTARDPAAVR
jgi:hypothetical protein